MKLFKTASGKDVLSIEKEEWAKIGLEKGWMVSVQSDSSSGGNVNKVAQSVVPETTIPVWQCRICGRTADASAFQEETPPACPFCDSIYINKFE